MKSKIKSRAHHTAEPAQGNRVQVKDNIDTHLLSMIHGEANEPDVTVGKVKLVNVRDRRCIRWQRLCTERLKLKRATSRFPQNNTVLTRLHTTTTTIRFSQDCTKQQQQYGSHTTTHNNNNNTVLTRLHRTTTTIRFSHDHTKQQQQYGSHTTAQNNNNNNTVLT